MVKTASSSFCPSRMGAATGTLNTAVILFFFFFWWGVRVKMKPEHWKQPPGRTRRAQGCLPMRLEIETEEPACRGHLARALIRYYSLCFGG